MIDSSASQAGEGGVYNITVTATDAAGTTATQTFTWTVTNPSPTAIADLGTTDVDSVLTVDADGILANDLDPDGDALAVGEVAGATGNLGTPIAGVGSGVGNGAFIINADGSYSFDPNGEFDYLGAGESETSTISYAVSDGEGGTSTSSITVTITGANDAPVAVNDANIFDEDTTAVGNVLSNDSDVDSGTILTVTAFTVNGANYPVLAGTPGTAVIAGVGTLVMASDGSYSFSPAADYDGAIPVATYTVSDGTLTDTGT